MEDLKAACEAVEATRKALNDLVSQFNDLGDRVTAAEKELTDSDAHLSDVLGREILGEATADKSKAATKARDAARDRLAGLRSAAKVVGGRITEAKSKYDDAKRAADRVMQPYAEKLAADALADARAHAALFASHLHRWYLLDGTALGGCKTGLNQQRAFVDVLNEHGFRGTEYLQIGQFEGRDPLLTPQQVLAALEPK